MRRATVVRILAIGVSAFASTAFSIAQSAPPATDDANKEAAAAPADEARAESLLRQMADYLGTQPALACRAEMVIEIEFQGRQSKSATTITARLERPNKLAIELDSGGGTGAMSVISDGKKLVQYIAATNRYTLSDAPEDFAKWGDSDAAVLANLGQLLPASGERLFKQLMDGVTGADYLGTEKVGDVECHHLKFLQEDIDWELWIEAGDRPLPLRYVPDYSRRIADQEGMKLQYVVTFTDWDVAPKFTAADFQFDTPAGAEEVESLVEALATDDEGPHPLLGQPAPEFQTVDLEGNAIDLKSHLGTDMVMLDFWATWCGPCVAAMPVVDRVAENFADRGLVFYAVNVGEDAETVKEFLASKGFDVPVAMDQENEISGLYRADGIPQTVLIGKDGKVQAVHVGYGGSLADQLTSEIADLLAGKDLAGDALAKAADARKKKRAAARQQVATVGVTPAWSLPGRWSGVFAPPAGDLVYAAAHDKIVAVDPTGEVKRKIDTNTGGVLRLANLLGDGAPEFLLFSLWQSDLSARSGSGEQLWQYPQGNGIDDVWAADLNADGLDEVIIGFNGGTGLHVLDHRGTPLWKFTDIGNVWHVAAGDFNRDGKTNVISTSALGKLHVFDHEGENLKNIDLSIYGNMVRMAALPDGTPLAIVAGSGSAGETLVGVDYDGNERFSVVLPVAAVAHADDMAIAPAPAWAAVAMRGGLVNVVDLETAQVIARVSGQGLSTQVTWLPRQKQAPLLVVATSDGLNAFEITPDAGDRHGDDAAADEETPPTDEP